jgi:hypothetical protein
LSATWTNAVSAPAAAGLKVTVTVQDAPAATLVPHVFVCENDVMLVPLMVTPWPVPFRFSGTLPVLVSVTFCVTAAVPIVVLAKVSAVGESVAVGNAPVPLKLTFWGDPVALSVIEILAVSAPTAAGVKVTVILQELPAATLVPHVFV